MVVIEEGPNLGGGDGRPAKNWTTVVGNLGSILAALEDSSIGASVQKSGDFGESSAIVDQLIGKVGPMIGEWNPEKGNRMIQEF